MEELFRMMFFLHLCSSRPGPRVFALVKRCRMLGLGNCALAAIACLETERTELGRRDMKKSCIIALTSPGPIAQPLLHPAPSTPAQPLAEHYGSVIRPALNRTRMLNDMSPSGSLILRRTCAVSPRRIRRGVRASRPRQLGSALARRSSPLGDARGRCRGVARPRRRRRRPRHAPLSCPDGTPARSSTSARVV